MNYRKYAVIGYGCYLVSYLALVLVSGKIHGFNISVRALTDVVTYIALPILICVIVGGLVWVIKRNGFLDFILKSMIFVAPLGVAINLLATYLLWWSSTNA